MAKGQIVSEFARIKGTLGTDAWVDDCVQAYNTGNGNEATLRSQVKAKRAAADAEISAILNRMVTDANGNRYVSSLKASDQDSLELAHWKRMRVDAAEAAINAVWPPANTTSDEHAITACTCLGNGHGGVKSGCTAKGQQKKADLSVGFPANLLATMGVEVKGD
jgi:hypothetical protein